MAAKLTRLIHKIAIQLHLVAESCTICIYRARRQVRKFLDTSSYVSSLPCVLHAPPITEDTHYAALDRRDGNCVRFTFYTSPPPSGWPGY